MVLLFWVALFIIFYAFLGYGIVLYALIKLKRLFNPSRGKIFEQIDNVDESSLPGCTLIIAAYNEADILKEKIDNCRSLSYPSGKLSILFVTDGSSDQSPQIILQHADLQLLHQDKREGKIMAIHRAMQYVTSEIVVFTDANTFLNQDALINMARHYENLHVGAVSGEKRVLSDKTGGASGSGEGIYWKYESLLKRWDSELYSVVGAAGELFSIRAHLYSHLPADTILDDFMLSMNIAKMGYRIIYEPAAYATEMASANVKEELKRKVRIAAGGIQSIVRLGALLNPLKYPVLSFQYVSHRVLRWTITPFLLIFVFFVNVWLCMEHISIWYDILMIGQALFYLLALIGAYNQQKNFKMKLFFIPYYFCMMNYAVLMGIRRYIKGEQSSIWEKAKRQNQTT